MASEESPFSTMMKAREKNALEELKLTRAKTELDVERRHYDKMMYNDIFEQKQIAYKLKQEVKDIKSRTDEEKKKRTRRRTHKKRPSVMTSQETPTTPASNTLPFIKQDKGKLKDVSGRLVGAFQTLNERSASMPTLPTILDEDENVAPTPARVIPMPLLKAVCTPPSANTQHARLPTIPVEAHLDKLPEERGKVRFASIVSRVIEQKAESDGVDGGGKGNKTELSNVFARLFPKRPSIVRQQSQDRFRDAAADQASSVEEEVEESGNPLEAETVIVVGDLWVGDPKAIGSVRRDRRPPEDLVNKENLIGEVRKLIRDMPQYPLCSRNCNRPGAALESIASSMPVYNLPQLVKAQLKRTKSASVDVLTLDEDIKNEDRLPVLDPNYARKKGQKMMKSTSDKRRALQRTTRLLHAKLDRVRGGVALQATQQVVKQGTHGARIQISYTFGGTKLRQGVM